MPRSLFRLSDEACAAIAPHDQPDARRVDVSRVISGIIPVLKRGRRWADAPAEHGPPTTV